MRKVNFTQIDREARQTILDRRRSYRLPHVMSSILTSGLGKLTSSKSSRAWGLPETRFVDEVLHYHSRHISLQLPGPRPVLKNAISEKGAEEIALKVDAALSFSKLSEDADPLVAPILLYYSCVHFCGVYCRAFFNWEQDYHGHGISCIHNSRRVGETRIIIRDRGQFLRMSTACFLFSGQPSIFCPIVTYSSSPIDHFEPGELLENFGKEEEALYRKEFTLDDLSTFDYGSELGIVRDKHGFHKFNGLPTTAFLLDFLTLFVGSSMARYDVLGWKKILEGRDNAYRLHFEETYHRFRNYGKDAILASLEDPTRGFDKNLIPSQPSPYSESDRSRFKKNPNYAVS